MRELSPALYLLFFFICFHLRLLSAVLFFLSFSFIRVIRVCVRGTCAEPAEA
jgi:hypothetical protein